MRILLLFLGFLSTILIIGQLVMGMLISGGATQYITAHKHTGYLTVPIALVYITLSMLTIASSTKSPHEL